MRWVSYTSTDGAERAGVLHENTIHAVAGGVTLLDLLTAGTLQDAGRQALASPDEVVPLAQARLLAPVPRPPSIRDFMAFEEHVVTSMKSLGQTVDPLWYQQPVFYFTNPAAVIGPHDPVPIAPGSRMWDYELEIAAIVGRTGRDLDPATAADHIAGYTVMCDWSARDLQAEEMRLNLGPAKGKDTATSLGPVLVTPDELAPSTSRKGYELAMTATVNGRQYSKGTWADQYWSFAEMLAYASRGTELRPGDVIGSGTVGTGCILELSGTHGSNAYPWLEPGDQVKLEVQGLGAITSTVMASPSPRVLLVGE